MRALLALFFVLVVGVIDLDKAAPSMIVPATKGSSPPHTLDVFILDPSQDINPSSYAGHNARCGEDVDGFVALERQGRRLPRREHGGRFEAISSLIRTFHGQRAICPKDLAQSLCDFCIRTANIGHIALPADELAGEKRPSSVRPNNNISDPYFGTLVRNELHTAYSMLFFLNISLPSDDEHLLFSDISPFAHLSSLSYSGVGGGFGGLRRNFSSGSRLLHMTGMSFGRQPQPTRRPPERAGEGDKREGFKNDPKIVMVLDRSREFSREDSDAIAGFLFLAGLAGLVTFVVVVEWRIRHPNPRDHSGKRR